MNTFLIQLAIVAQLMGVPLHEAFQTNAYLVPTTVDGAVEWRIDTPLRTDATVPEYDLLTRPTPQIGAHTALVMDVETQRILWQKQPDDAVPMASITKLMNALTWIDHMPAAGVAHVHTMSPEDDTPLGKEHDLPHGTEVRSGDILKSALIASNNDMAVALAHTTGLSDEAYLAAMNRKAHMLGMTSAHFDDQTGLSEHNTATPEDIARMALYAFRQPLIQTTTQLAEYTFTPENGDTATRVRTTNALLTNRDLQIIGGKTGFTYEAGYCLVTQARDPDTGRDILTVVLGADTDDARFADTTELIQWTFQHYDW